MKDCKKCRRWELRLAEIQSDHECLHEALDVAVDAVIECRRALQAITACESLEDAKMVARITYQHTEPADA